MYNAAYETRISADASLYGLGAVLQQKQASGELRLVAYISRALSETEQHYAQIEKEALAVTWACERFRDYLTGMQFHIETDHKPVVLTSKKVKNGSGLSFNFILNSLSIRPSPWNTFGNRAVQLCGFLK